jgi:peptidase MA superfamily protein
MRTVRISASVVVAVALLVVSLVAPVAAADPVTFGKPEATSTYGERIRFDQPVELARAPERIETLITTQGSDAPAVVDYDGRLRAGESQLQYEVLLSDGHITPNTRFTAQWRVTMPDGSVWLSPEISETYDDDRIDWNSLEGDVVRVHWHDGDEAFGQRALQIGEDAVAEVSQLLGVTEGEPIDFFIYADQGQFYDALGPATRENVGGEAHADIRTLFALIQPNEINDDWVQIVIPHELTHLVFDTATKNPYHGPPHWLNEGLAVYLSEGYRSSDRDAVQAAARDGTVMPLEGLAGAFPTTRDRFFLAYSESVSAVDAIVAGHGRDALISLIRSYADGVSDDEAFSAALGMDLGAFEQSWLDGLGATAPERHGPQPAPGGPLPAGWSGAAPNATIQPGATAAPPGATPGTNAPIEEPTSSAGIDPILVASLLVVGLAIAAVAIVAVRRSRRPGAAAVAAAPSGAGGSSAPPSTASPVGGPSWPPGGASTPSAGFSLPAPDETMPPVTPDPSATDPSATGWSAPPTAPAPGRQGPPEGRPSTEPPPPTPPAPPTTHQP